MTDTVTVPTLVYEGLSEASIGELQRIHDEEGAIRPERVVEVAQEPTNPLHEQFEWDDTEAARQHRLAQARQVIRSVRVYLADRPSVQVRAYVSMGMDHGREYRRTTEVVASQISMEQLRRGLHRDLVKLQRKLAAFEEFASAAAAVEAAATSLVA